jgi:proteasome lid subunit RPN8/RPN11
MTLRLEPGQDAVSNRTCLLPAALEEALRRDCEVRYPEEACGALLGTGAGEPWTVMAVRPVPNVHPADRRGGFVVSPELQLELERHARAAQQAVLGWYHSHPDYPAHPSERDRVEAWPGVLHLICAVVHGRSAALAAFTLAGSGGRFVGVDLRRV